MTGGTCWCQATGCALHTGAHTRHLSVGVAGFGVAGVRAEDLLQAQSEVQQGHAGWRRVSCGAGGGGADGLS